MTRLDVKYNLTLQLFTDHPELLKEQRRKNELLDENLKQVYVTSTDSVN